MRCSTLPILLVLTEYSSRDRIREEAGKRGLDATFVTSEGDPIDDGITCDMLAAPTEVLASLRSQLRSDPVGILNCNEQTSVRMAEVAELLGIASSPATAALTLRDKRLMKQSWSSAGIPTPMSTVVYSVDEVRSHQWRFPMIVKPASGAASAGVRLVTDDEDLARSVRKVLRFNHGTLEKEGLQTSGALIEHYVDGPEYAVDLIWHDGWPVRAGVLSKGSPNGPTFPDRLYYIDPEMGEKTAQSLVSTATAAGRAAGVHSGATHTEMRLSPDGTAWVLESALRPGASAGLYATYEQGTGTNFFGPLIDTALPHTLRQTPMEADSSVWNHPVHAAFWYNVRYTQTGRIRRLETPENFASSHPLVPEVIWRRKIGDYLPPEGASYGYLAWFRGPTNTSAEVLLPALEKAESSLIVECD